MPSPPQTPVRSRNATHPEVIPDSPITGPETSRRLSHPVLLRGAFYAIGYAVTFGVITSLAKFTYDHGASPQTAVWSRILAAVLMGGWHVLSPQTKTAQHARCFRKNFGRASGAGGRHLRCGDELGLPRFGVLHSGEPQRPAVFHLPLRESTQ